MTTTAAVDVRRRLRFGLLGLMVWALVSPAGPVAHAEPATLPALASASQPSGGGFNFGVTPYSAPGAPVRSAFNLDGAVGGTLRDRVAIINSGSQPKQFWVYAADAYTTEFGGGFALRTRGDKPADVAAWVTMPVRQYTVPAGTVSAIPFLVHVPTDATPGDHTAGIVAEEVVTPGAVTRGAGVTTIHRVGARLYLRVAGPARPSLHLQSYQTAHRSPLFPVVHGRGRSGVSFLVANTGNVRVRLDQVTISETGLFGRQLHQHILRPLPPGETKPGESLPAEILPGSKVRLGFVFNGLPALDHVTAHVRVTGEDAVSNSRVSTGGSRSFWLIPWLVVLIVVAVGSAIVWRRRRARRTPRPAAEPDRAFAEPASPTMAHPRLPVP